METRAHNALIGLFTLAVVAAALGFVIWFARISDYQAVKRLGVDFSGSVAGLTVGSPVLFNGIRVGEVNTLDINPKDPSHVIALISVKNTTPIKSDTVARLELSGLAGGVNLQLIGGRPDAPDLAPAKGEQLAMLSAQPSQLQTLLDNASKTVSQASLTMNHLDSWLDHNEDSVAKTLDNVQTFTKALADNSDHVSTFLQNTGDAAKEIGDFASKLSGMSGDVQKLITAISPAKIDAIVSNAQAFTAALGKNSDELTAVIKDAHTVASNLAEASPKVSAAFDNFNRVAGAIDSGKINEIVANLDKLSKTLGDSTGQVKQIVADASQVAAKLNAAADQLDGIMKNITNMTSSQSSQGMFAEVTEAAKSIRQLANNLDTRSALLIKNLDQFSGGGLRDYQQIAVDGQRTLQNIQRTLNSLQRNPQQLLFGPKSNIPDYKGK